MMFSKKIMAFLLAGCLLVLSACGSSPPDTQSAVQTESNVSESESGTPTATEVPEATETVLKPIPEEYYQPAGHQGTVERIDYTSNTYDEQNQTLEKYAFVYLPYGYDEADTTAKYNILYLQHGGGGSAEMYFGGENGNNSLKHILDHMIESGELEPTIVVTPSYYQNNHSGQDGALTENFHHELVGT